jgi:Ca-activated chloride channel family protein
MRLRPLLLLAFAVCFVAGCRRAGSPAPEQSTSVNQPDTLANGDLQLLFSYGSEKQKWIDDVTAAFNASGAHTRGGKRIQVNAIPKGSGECLDDVLSGREHDDLISPASAIFITQGNAQSRAAMGADVVGPTQNLLLSPVVIAMWKPMAEAIGWGKKPIGWADILALAHDKKGWASFGYPQWGQFKFGHTHPQYSNSGIISLIAENYAALPPGHPRALTAADVDSTKTQAFVRGIEDSVVHYGSSTGFFGQRLFDSGPEYLSAAVLYESMVVQSYGPDQKPMPFPVVAIYPKEGTFWSDHPVGIVNRPWVTAERKEAAQIYIDYLLARPRQQKALTYGFRPGLADIAAGAPIDAAHGVDPTQPKTVLPVPPADVIARILREWTQTEEKPADVVLVLDTSGSMSEDAKLDNAKLGAKQLVSLLGDKDTFSMESFSDTSAWAVSDQQLGISRARSNTAIESLFAGGQTALYDAIDTAYAHLQQKPADHIRALVVLTDGEDNLSRESLSDLLAKVHADGEAHTIRIFTIAYGADAQKSVLKQIAAATQGKDYVGTPRNIVEVFRDISTFF